MENENIDLNDLAKMIKDRLRDAELYHSAYSGVWLDYIEYVSALLYSQRLSGFDELAD